jgi:hypothetical protein
MPIWKIPGMSMLQRVERHVNTKGASASVEVDCIKAGLEEDSDVEVGEGRYGSTLVNAFGTRADIQRGKKLCCPTSCDGPSEGC